MRASSRVSAVRAWVAVVAMVTALPLAVPVSAQTAGGEALGTARIPQAVLADGQPLAAGSYTLRLSTDSVEPVVGQPAGAERWVDFLQRGQVKGRELASVVAPADVQQVAKRTPPASGRPLVQSLRGADYVRIWVNHQGTQYLIHLTVARH